MKFNFFIENIKLILHLKSFINLKKQIMRRVILVILVAVLVIPAFQSCKKGENDPAISFLSRKARLVGEWKLKEGTLSRNNAGNIYNYSYNGSTVVVSGGANDSWSYTNSIKIEKDGTFTETLLEDGDQTVFEGNWFFLSGNKDGDLKNKECVDFVFKTVTYTPAGGSPEITNIEGFVNMLLYPYNGLGYTWQLDELKNKEIIVKVDAKISSSTVKTIEGTLTFEQ